MVVAIILILASMLLPALSEAKERGRRTLCRANLHQWGQVLNMYADDFDGQLPPHAENQAYLMVFDFSNDYDFSEFLIPTYGIPRGVWFCPSDTHWRRGAVETTGNLDYFWDPTVHVYGRASSYVILTGGNYSRTGFINGGRDVASLQELLPEDVLMADIARLRDDVEWRDNNHLQYAPAGAASLTGDGAVGWHTVANWSPQYQTVWLGVSHTYHW